MKINRNPVETDVNKLHQVSSNVDISDRKLVGHIEYALLATYRKLDGRLQGLAAIQCRLPYCAILLRYVKGKEPVVIFNPEVLFSFGKKKSNEGCLSEGKSRYIVERPLLVKVQYTNIDGLKVKEWLPYAKARIFMHEYDHLKGVLLQDKGILVEEKIQ